MIYPSDEFDLIRPDDLPPAGSHVALGCPHPDCSWVSSPSLVLDDPRANEVDLALYARRDEWDRHWADAHQPLPLHLVAKDPERINL